jgi:hypothetical protein
MTRPRPHLLSLILLIASIQANPSRAADPIYPKAKVDLAFNRLYDYPEMEAALKKLAAAHPDLLSFVGWAE